MDRGEDEGAGLALRKIIHPVASSAGAFQVAAPFNSHFYCRGLSLKKKKDCGIAGSYFTSNEFIQQRGLAGRQRWWKSFGF